MKSHGAIHSNSKKCNPYDDAVMEYLYIVLEKKLIQEADLETLEQV